MANIFKIKRTKTPGKTPTTTQLQEGELALNLPDEKLFTSDGAKIIELGKVDYASDAEVKLGTVTDKVISPKGLESRVAKDYKSNFGINATMTTSAPWTDHKSTLLVAGTATVDHQIFIEISNYIKYGTLKEKSVMQVNIIKGMTATQARDAIFDEMNKSITFVNAAKNGVNSVDVTLKSTTPTSAYPLASIQNYVADSKYLLALTNDGKIDGHRLFNTTTQKITVGPTSEFNTINAAIEQIIKNPPSVIGQRPKDFPGYWRAPVFEIYLESGEHIIDKQIYIDNINITIIGKGISTTTIKTNDPKMYSNGSWLFTARDGSSLEIKDTNVDLSMSEGMRFIKLESKSKLTLRNTPIKTNNASIIDLYDMSILQITNAGNPTPIKYIGSEMIISAGMGSYVIFTGEFHFSLAAGFAQLNPYNNVIIFDDYSKVIFDPTSKYGFEFVRLGKDYKHMNKIRTKKDFSDLDQYINYPLGNGCAIITDTGDWGKSTSGKAITVPSATPADDEYNLVRLNATGKIDEGFFDIDGGTY